MAKKQKYHRLAFVCQGFESEAEMEELKALYKQAHELLTARVNEGNTGKPVIVFTALVVEVALNALVFALQENDYKVSFIQEPQKD